MTLNISVQKWTALTRGRDDRFSKEPMRELASAGHTILPSQFNRIHQMSPAVYTFTMWTALVSAVLYMWP